MKGENLIFFLGVLSETRRNKEVKCVLFVEEATQKRTKLNHALAGGSFSVVFFRRKNNFLPFLCPAAS